MSLLFLLRKTREWTQGDLARESGLDQARIARIEKDDRPMRLQRHEHLMKIGGAFGLTADQLVLLTDHPIPEPDPQERRRLGQQLRASRKKRRRPAPVVPSTETRANP